jgi:hypothetical protein
VRKLLFIPFSMAGGLVAGFAASRIGFYRLTGRWPGEEEPETT